LFSLEKNILSVIFRGVILIVIIMESKDTIKEICPTSAKKLIEEGYMLLDIREKFEVENLAFDVSKIMYISLSELVERYVIVPRDEKIIGVCESGERSWRAVSFLQDLGFTNLLNMKKGLEKWVQKGFPILGDHTVIPEKAYCGSSHC
jgi:rhodanese-related sulfurtransferase